MNLFSIFAIVFINKMMCASASENYTVVAITRYQKFTVSELIENLKKPIQDYAKLKTQKISPDNIIVKIWFNPKTKTTFESVIINLHKIHNYTFMTCFYGKGLLHYKENQNYKLLKNSWAALTVCEEENLTEGFLLLENEGFLLENTAISNKHKRSLMPNENNFPGYEEKASFFNLTGDTFENGSESKNFNQWSQFTSDEKIEPLANLKMPTKTLTSTDQNHSTYDLLEASNKGYRVFTTTPSVTDFDLLESNFTKAQTNWLSDEDDDDELGYFYDSAWKSVTAKPSYRQKHHQHGLIPQRFLEIVIAIDDSVIKFHGRQRVEQYVLTLMNIVNALYQDPSLEAKLQLVVKEFYFYEKNRHVIKVGNAKKSLENVNLWNKDLHLKYEEDDEPHDIALWLTRVDIGGPSGYAPVGGVCDPERSCALTRDEGLTCAFIIAHELAHILGLSHDGDPKNSNTCKDEAQQGSVMAPMVSATFHHFLWSECSRKEFAMKVKQWQCLLNHPDMRKSIGLNSTLGTKFTMDEQCRVEFGEGYVLCRSFDIVEPCAHLWCGHVKSPLVCKTKKGPPLEGTECAPQKWCIDGYCDSTLRTNMDPLKFNQQDGGWSEWSGWNTCSRTCGVGMQFRTRECNNPRPAYGGNECDGLPEEWQVCNVPDCPDQKDFRAQQCLRMPKLLDVPWNNTWLPYESEQEDLKCKYICQTKETGEIYASEEFLVDGTLCSYETDNRRCVQGQCVTIGCDHKINSSVILDGCGVCAGNGSQCTRIRSSLTKRIKKRKFDIFCAEITRLGVVHNQARHVAIEFEFHGHRNWGNGTHRIDFDLFLKDRQRNIHWIRKSIDRLRNKWEFNQSPVVVQPNAGDAHKDEKMTTLKPLRKKNDHVNDVLIEPDIFEPYSGITATIIHGAKFRFHVDLLGTDGNNGTMYLSTLGPILSELILFIEVKNLGKHPLLTMKIDMEYLLHKKYKDTRYEWIIGGWGSCSKSCGSGKMFKTKACVEKITQRIVPRKYCSIVNKPPTEVQSCNNFSCSFIWISGDWEPCSTTCGSKGMQNREIYCIPQTLENDTTDVNKAPWKYMLPPSKCGYQPPSTTRPCARTYCPGHWEFTQWSKCSASCEYGVQSREAKCHPNLSYSPNTTGNLHGIDMAHSYKEEDGDSSVLEEYSCGVDEKNGPREYQLCTNNKNNCKSCPGDTSVLCGLNSLKRYCRIDSFRELCCHSCSLHWLTPIQI